MPPVKVFLFNLISHHLLPINFNDENNKKMFIFDLNFIIKIFSFFILDSNLISMNSPEFYSMFFDCILLLFYSFHFSFRTKILDILNKFSMFNECKFQILKSAENMNKCEELKTSETASTEDDDLSELEVFFNNKKKNVPGEVNQSLNIFNKKLNENMTSIESLNFNHKIFALLKLRIVQCFIKLKQVLSIYEDISNVNKLQRKTVDKMMINHESKESLKHEENSNICSQTVETTKQLYFEVLKDYGLLISIFCNFIVIDDFDEVCVKILEYDGFIDKLKEMTDYFQKTYYFHRELEMKNNPYSFLKDYVNQLYLILFIIFPDAKIEFVGEKIGGTFYREDNKKNSILLRLYDLLKNNKQNYDFTSKVVFCVNRFLKRNILYKSYTDNIVSIVKEIVPFIYTNVKLTENEIPQYDTILIRESFKLIFTLINCSNILLHVKADSFKLNKDASGKNIIFVKYKNRQLKHFTIKRGILSNNIFEDETLEDESDSNPNALPDIYKKKVNSGVVGAYGNSDFINIANVRGIENQAENFSIENLKALDLKNPNLSKAYKSIISQIEFIKKLSNFMDFKHHTDEQQDKKEDENMIFLENLEENIEYYNNFIKYFSKNSPYQKFDPDLIFYPPYQKVTKYFDRGCIFHSEHKLILEKPLQLKGSFSISVKFFLPFPDTGSFHTLLQDEVGLGGIIVVDKTRTSLGLFTCDGKWIDSGIDLTIRSIQSKWNCVSLTYCEFSDSSKVNFYLNGLETKAYDLEKLILPKRIKYLGNSDDYKEPFGVWCDLRIYDKELDEEEIFRDFRDSYIEDNFITEMNKTIYSLVEPVLIKRLISPISNEEIYLNSIKLLNIYLMTYSLSNKVTNYEVLLHVFKSIDTPNNEIHNEIAKFVANIY